MPDAGGNAVENTMSGYMGLKTTLCRVMSGGLWGLEEGLKSRIEDFRGEGGCGKE